MRGLKLNHVCKTYWLWKSGCNYDLPVLIYCEYLGEDYLVMLGLYHTILHNKLINVMNDMETHSAKLALTSHRWIHLTKGRKCGALIFYLLFSWTNCCRKSAITSAGLCGGCILGTFSTLKSGMSPIILTVGANVPTHLRFMNGNMTEVTPEKLQMSPYFSMLWVICPHFSKALAKHCQWLDMPWCSCDITVMKRIIIHYN